MSCKFTIDRTIISELVNPTFTQVGRNDLQPYLVALTFNMSKNSENRIFCCFHSKYKSNYNAIKTHGNIEF